MVAEVALGEDRVGVDATGEGAFVEGDAGEDSGVVFQAGIEKLALGRLVEDVVDDLHGVYESGFDDAEGSFRLVVVDGDTYEADFTGSLQVFEGAAPFIAFQPFRVPDVELLEVDAIQAEVAEAGFGGLDDVLVGEDFVDGCSQAGGPNAVHRWNFGGHVEGPGGFADHLANELLALAVTVSECRVDQVDAVGDGKTEGGQRGIVVGTNPLFATDPPSTVAKDGNIEAGTAQFARLHSPSL